jgi:hypothetical protein
MKRSISRKAFFCFFVLLIGPIITINVNHALEVKKGNVSLSYDNIMALAHTFYFDGTEWDDNHHWYNGVLAQKPVPIYCKELHQQPTLKYSTGGSIDILGTGFSWNGVSITSGGSITEWNGIMVQCQGGDGNCWNGTPCRGIAVNNV